MTIQSDCTIISAYSKTVHIIAKGKGALLSCKSPVAGGTTEKSPLKITWRGNMDKEPKKKPEIWKYMLCGVCALMTILLFIGCIAVGVNFGLNYFTTGSVYG